MCFHTAGAGYSDEEVPRRRESGEQGKDEVAHARRCEEEFSGQLAKGSMGPGETVVAAVPREAKVAYRCDKSHIDLDDLVSVIVQARVAMN